MTAQLFRLSDYRVAQPRKITRVHAAFDPLWIWRFWMAFWGIR